MKAALLLLSLLCIAGAASSQAYFTSNGNGDWSDSTSWTRVSGTSTTGYPAAGDSAVVQSSDTIHVTTNVQCQSLTVKGTSEVAVDSANAFVNLSGSFQVIGKSTFKMNNGLLLAIGSVTINNGSAFVQTGGIATVSGLIFLTAPATANGTSAIQVDAGAFTCAGGLTITSYGLPGKFAELRIGEGAVTVIGALTTLFTNSKITFTGRGTLTQAGPINIQNASSFTAGNGTVIYLGIPGSNQDVAQLTYHNMVITGIGNGVKALTGSATVVDTLTLLTDTFQISSSGVLNMSNNSAIVKTAGKITAAPTFLGQVDIVYNNPAQDTTGFEMPTAVSTLRNLIVSTLARLVMNQNVVANNKITLQNGELNVNNHTLLLSNTAGGILSDTAVERTNGYIRGAFSRAIGTSVGIRTFPLGVRAVAGYRAFTVNYITPPTAQGILTVEHFDTAASMQSGFPLTDATVVLDSALPYYWHAAATALTGGQYNLTLTGEGTTNITDISGLRIVKRASAGSPWMAQGVPGRDSGTTTAPVVNRLLLSGFSDFAIAYSRAAFPLKLLGFDAKKLNDKIVSVKWRTVNEDGIRNYEVERSFNSREFSTIGTVSPRNDYNTINDYSFTDNNLSRSILYYRLKSVDYSGLTLYSKVVAVKIAAVNSFEVYPTAVASGFSINSMNARATYRLYSQQGSLLRSLNRGYNTCADLPAGVYYVGDGETVKKLVKQ